MMMMMPKPKMSSMNLKKAIDAMSFRVGQHFGGSPIFRAS